VRIISILSKFMEEHHGKKGFHSLRMPGNLSPDNCVVECRTCASLCHACAISFPDEEKFTAYIKEKLERKR
jgi:NAD-dependent dihydropyrimidine dehydrogenase PreA subunit